MDCSADDPDNPVRPVRLNKCPYCSLTFIDTDRPVLCAHIQHHLDSLRIPDTRCHLANRCHNFQTENSDQLARHIMQSHIRTRQSKSNMNRVKRAVETGLIIRNGLIRRLANNDPDEIQRPDRPFARQPNLDEPARHQIDNRRPYHQQFRPVDNFPRHQPQLAFANLQRR